MSFLNTAINKKPFFFSEVVISKKITKISKIFYQIFLMKLPS